MSIYMLFVNKLMTIIGLGEMLMVLSQQLPTVSKTDSTPDIVNGAATLISETDGFLAKKTLGGVDLNTMSSNKRHLKRTRRKKRNFVKVFNKFNNISTSKPSTCTPFFVHQTKMASRKRNRLKKPMHLAAEQDSIITTNKSTKEKGKIRKLFLPKNHSTISLSVANSSKLLDDKDKRKTTITYDFLKHLSETISSNESAPGTDGRLHFTLVEDCVNSDPLAIEYNISTVRTKSNRATSEMQHPTTNNNLKNLDNQSNESPMCLINVSNTPNESTGYKAKFKLDRFYIKNIFHVTKTSSSTFSDSIGLPKTPTETGVVIQYYNTLAETCPMEYTTPKNTTELVIENSEFTSSTPTNTFKLIKMFNKLKPFKRVFTISTREPADLNTEEPVLYETQILPSPSQRTVGKENSRGRILSSAKLSKDSLGSKHVPNMLHNDQQTTLTDINSSLIFEGNTRFTMKQINGDTNFFSEPSLTPSTIQGKCELHSFSKHDRKDFMGHVLKYGKQNAEDKKETIHSLFKTTVGNKMKGFYQNSVNGTVGSIQKVRSEETLNNNGENTKRSHSPFRVKYLIKFRRPTYCSQSSRDLTFADLTSNESFNKGKVNSVSKRHFTFNVTTEPMNTKNNLTVHSDSKSSTASNNVPAIHKFNQTQFTMATDHFQHHSKIKVDGNIGLCGTTKDTLTAGNKLFEDAQSSLSFTESGLGRYKSQTKNKNREHYTRIPTSSKIKGSMKQNTEVDFKEKFNVTVYKDNSERFRNWFLRKTTRLPNIRYGKNEKNVTFRWCFQPSFKESATKTKYNPVNETSKTSAESGEGQYVTQYSSPPNKKIKHFFHFKTPQFTVAVHLNDTTENSVSYNMIKEHTNNTNIMPIEPNTSTKRYGEEDEKLHRNFDPNSSSAIIRNKFQLETTTQKLHLNSTQVKSNVSIQVYRRGKVKKLLNKFYTEKMHLFSLNNKNSSKKGKNGTVVLNPEYADYIETKVETKTHKKYINKTVLHNAADVNDTSFNVMAYVMKPFDSLISVFKALSPNSVTKIGDVNATDIKNGSLPDHLQPPNSSIVILAVNNTNATSKDVHESKLEMALDLLGGMYHCMFNSFVEATPQDVHFYLYTRKNLEEPEELFLPQEQKENVTEDTHVPEPILEKELSSEMPHKRAIEYDEYDYGDYEFEPMNDAKSEIHSKWFNVRAETKVLIHGYLQDYQTDIMVTMKDAYLSQGPYNVVVVDWSVLVGDSSCYPVVASRGLRQVGDLLARLLDRLADAGASPSKMHVVGFSLGAHVAGHAGTFLSHGLLSRITGLDPALPYVPMEPNVSLDSGDAMFVDIIHSAAGLLGQSGPMGHIDFYPNGGSQQPGCEVSSLSCSHRRAALYFIESITSESGFPATRCDSWHHFQADDCSNTTILMGDPCPANSSGKFYLLTGYKSPFALQPQEHVQVKKSLLLDLFYDSEDL